MSVSTIYMRGGSLNLLSLMGLMLAVGMVVDNAIVVVEAIYSRRLDGEEGKKAAVDGANEVALAISLSTLTTIAAPFTRDIDESRYRVCPILGEIGFHHYNSHCESGCRFGIYTTYNNIFLKTKEGETLFVPKWVEWLTDLYKGSLEWVLRQKADSILALCVLGYLTISIPVQSVGCSENNEDSTEFEIRYTLPPQSSYYDRLDTVKTIESLVEENKERWGVELFFTIECFFQSRSGICILGSR